MKANGGTLTFDDPNTKDIDFGGFSLNPTTGQFVIRSSRTGKLNGHHIEWKKLDEDEMCVVCTKCEQGIAIEPNSEAVKWLHGYFYSSGCPEDESKKVGQSTDVTQNPDGSYTVTADINFKW